MAGLQADTDILAGLAEAQRVSLELEKKGLASPHSDEEHELDGVHDDLEFPTEEEKQTLRRVSDTLPLSAYCEFKHTAITLGCILIATVVIAFCELAERFSYYGSTVVYVSVCVHNLQAKVLTPCSTDELYSAASASRLADWCKHQAGRCTRPWAARLHWYRHLQHLLVRLPCNCQPLRIDTVVSRVYVIPLFGAYIADTRWGRYKTVCIAVGIAIVGHILLIISSIPGVIEKSHGALACFIIAIIIMGVGTGGFKSNVSPLVAEQYKRTKLFIGHTKSGERVVVDPIMTTSRIYMYFYLFTNVGALIGQISMAYSEKVRLLTVRENS